MLEELRKEKRERELFKKKKTKQEKRKEKGVGFFERWRRSKEEAALERERRRKKRLEEKERKKRELKLKVERLKREKSRKRREKLRMREWEKKRRLEEKGHEEGYAFWAEEKRKKDEEREIQEAIRIVKSKETGFNMKGRFRKRPKEGLPIKEVSEMTGEVLPEKKKFLAKAPKPIIKKEFNELEFVKERIYDARDALTELDLQMARHIYSEIMASYQRLKDKDKAKVYYDIKELYDDRKHAEAMFEKK